MKQKIAIEINPADDTYCGECHSVNYERDDFIDCFIFQCELQWDGEFKRCQQCRDAVICDADLREVVDALRKRTKGKQLYDLSKTIDM